MLCAAAHKIYNAITTERSERAALLANQEPHATVQSFGTYPGVFASSGILGPEGLVTPIKTTQTPQQSPLPPAHVPSPSGNTTLAVGGNDAPTLHICGDQSTLTVGVGDSSDGRTMAVGQSGLDQTGAVGDSNLNPNQTGGDSTFAIGTSFT
jgi:hypothetical protein